MMETLLGGQEALRSPDAVTQRLLIDAKRSFAGIADEAFLERAAREAVDAVWQDPIKVTSFVPVLAMRRMKEIVSNHRIAGAVADR
jgi:hypothetical protein